MSNKLNIGDKFIYTEDGSVYTVKDINNMVLLEYYDGNTDKFSCSKFSYSTILSLQSEPKWKYMPVNNLPEELFKL